MDCFGDCTIAMIYVWTPLGNVPRVGVTVDMY